MFPIPSERKLSVVEIADYWSGDIMPPRSAQDLRDVISKAWWSGELTAANGASRLSVLRGYYLRSAKFIAFAIPNSEEPPQWVADDDGVIEFVRPLRVPLPNANPDTWTEADCAPAFDAIAQLWKEAVISPYPIFLDIVLTSSEFFQWVDACGYKRPTFWSCPPEVKNPEAPPGDQFAAQTSRPQKGKRGRISRVAGPIRRAVFDLMDYHGDLSADDPEWRVHADVERAVHAKLGDDSPAISTGRVHVASAIAEWRNKKRTVDN